MFGERRESLRFAGGNFDSGEFKQRPDHNLSNRLHIDDSATGRVQVYYYDVFLGLTNYAAKRAINKSTDKVGRLLVG